jgi:flagellin
MRLPLTRNGVSVLRIHTNVSALTSWRNYDTINRKMESSIEKLSSGYRINRAADDVAGLAISERMRSQIRGMNQAMANIQDEINMVQTAEGSLSEISAMLLRGRELAVQAANGTNTDDDKAYLNDEMTSLLAEVDRLTVSTEFNSKRLLGGQNKDVADMVESLRRSWLANAESLVATQYGLVNDPSSPVALKIVADTGPGNNNHLAWVSGSPDGSGKLTNLELHVNMNLMKNLTLPNGGSPPLYADRVIAHEMTHAIMGRTMNFAALPQWFQEGAAEFIAGADERLKADMSIAGGAANIVNEIDTWDDTSADYSAAYAAVKYLDSRATAAGHTTKELMGRLAAGDTLDQAISFVTNGAIATTAAFVTDFKTNGAAFIGTLNLNDADVGAIGGGTAETVVADTNVDTWDPLVHFQEAWPDQSNQAQPDLFVGETVPPEELPQLATGVYSLGLGPIDLVKDAPGAIDLVDGAIVKITSMRATLGALQNRLEHTYNASAIQAENLTAAESRIRDVDMAQEMAQFTKFQITLQSSTAMMAQANNMRRESMQRLLAG